jgi:hypothetical protein
MHSSGGDIGAVVRNGRRHFAVDLDFAAALEQVTCSAPPERTQAAWLGRQDSNLGMTESKSVALPLGYAPSESTVWRPDHSGRGCADQRVLYTVK